LNRNLFFLPIFSDAALSIQHLLCGSLSHHDDGSYGLYPGHAPIPGHRPRMGLVPGADIRSSSKGLPEIGEDRFRRMFFHGMILLMENFTVGDSGSINYQYIRMEVSSCP
jgi:hypothetical protein